jgi:hypothetical protein
MPARTSIETAICWWVQRGSERVATRWWLGDALCLAESQWTEREAPSFGETWNALLADLGLKATTGAHYRRVSRAIPIERRHERLSWSHHERVASLPPAEQELLLEAAELEGLSVGGLHAAITRKALCDSGPESDSSELEQVQPRLSRLPNRSRAGARLLPSAAVLSVPSQPRRSSY